MLTAGGKWRWPSLFAAGLGLGVVLGVAFGLPSGGAAAPDIPAALRQVPARIVSALPTPQGEDGLPLSARFAPPLSRAGRPRIAIVIDDLGLDWGAFRQAEALPPPVTLSFLPYGEEAQAMLETVGQGHEIMLHLPMQPTIREEDAGPDMLRTGQGAAALSAALAKNLEKLRGYEGVNNHTGSLFTADAEAMRVVLEALDRRGLYFLDSITTPRPVALDLAEEAGWRVIERDVFLDTDRKAGAPYVKKQLAQAEKIATVHGAAVVIGHPYEATLDTLGPWLVTAQARGFEIVTVSDLLPPAPVVTAGLR